MTKNKTIILQEPKTKKINCKKLKKYLNFLKIKGLN